MATGIHRINVPVRELICQLFQTGLRRATSYNWEAHMRWEQTLYRANGRHE